MTKHFKLDLLWILWQWDRYPSKQFYITVSVKGKVNPVTGPVVAQRGVEV